MIPRLIALAAFLLSSPAFPTGQWRSVALAGEFNPQVTVGDAAPAWTDLPGVDGKHHSMADLDPEKPAVVVFTCNSCDVATEYEDRIIAFAKQHAGPTSKVAFVAVNVNKIPADNLAAMKKGDRAFFYHSGEGKEIVGVSEIIKEAYPDATDKTGAFVCVDLKAIEPLKTPVTLAAIKADRKLGDMVLVKNSRLSVQPVTPDEWKAIRKMGGLK